MHRPAPLPAAPPCGLLFYPHLLVWPPLFVRLISSRLGKGVKVGTAGKHQTNRSCEGGTTDVKVGKPKNPSINHHAGRLVGYSYGSSLVQVIAGRTNGIGMLNGNLKRSKRFSINL